MIFLFFRLFQAASAVAASQSHLGFQSHLDSTTPKVKHIPLQRASILPVSSKTKFSSPIHFNGVGTALEGKLWERLQIEEDAPEVGTSWYLINCVAGVELDLLEQCRFVCRDFPKKDVEKFVVPTERHLRSHGDKKKVVDVKVRYPGYVFCKIRLKEDVYETLQALELARSWMGTINRKGHKKLPPAPIPLSDEEVKKFKGLEDAQEEFEELYGGDYSGREDSGSDLLAQYKGYDVGQMVKILKGNFQGEDGTVRRLKDGQICVRMFTYGQSFDHWFDPDAIRPLTDLEVMRGLSGPTSPISQDQFDVSIGKKDPRELEGDPSGSVGRAGLLQSAGYGAGRNRREDRIARGETGNRDVFGRTSEEIKQEEDNWLAYREEQRAIQRESSKFNNPTGKEEPKAKNKEARKGDTWGIVERSSWTGGEYGFEADSEEEELAHQRRTAELYKDRRERGRRRGERNQNPFEQQFGGRDRDMKVSGPIQQNGGHTERDRNRKGYDDDPNIDNDWGAFSSKTNSRDGSESKEEDFFASLMSELSNDLTSRNSLSEESRDLGTRHYDNTGLNSKKTTDSSRSIKSNSEDDFFENLMSELGGAMEDPNVSSLSGEMKNNDDDFFASLESELSSSLSSEFGAEDDRNEISDDDFFSNLQKEMSESLNELPDSADVALNKIFSSDAIDDVPDKFEQSETQHKTEGTPPTKGESSPKDFQLKVDLESMTIPELKEMLRIRGLKVGGRKNDLIERLRAC